MRKDIAIRYNITPGHKYEPLFVYHGQRKGTGVILAAESAAEFAAYYEQQRPNGKLVFAEVNSNLKG